MQSPILVTGGAGFIGSNFILRWLATEGAPVLNLDKLTYAGNLRNLAAVRAHPAYTFIRGDINDRGLLAQLLTRYRPRAIVHFAAQTHVDRSILDPGHFVRANVEGTFHLLEAARAYWEQMPAGERVQFRFLHVSTDEVYGSLDLHDPPFHEGSPYAPTSPYSASKAAADHFTRAYYYTFGLPTLVTNCSNNYGPYQFPEKLIPLMILQGLKGMPLPVYGDGLHVRDWIYVTDHCDAIRLVLQQGRVGQTYNIGGGSERSNLEVVRTICSLMDEVHSRSDGQSYCSLLSFVKDRPGHDRRYAMDTSKIQRELGWQPSEVFQSGLRKTVNWYLSNLDWVEDVTTGEYQKWMETQYAATSAVTTVGLST